MLQHTDDVGCSIVKQLIRKNSKLNKSITSGAEQIAKTVKHLTKCQPLRHKLLPRIQDPQIQATYGKIIKNVGDLLKFKPVGAYGQTLLLSALSQAITIFST